MAQICLSRDSLNSQTKHRPRKIQNSVFVQLRCKRIKVLGVTYGGEITIKRCLYDFENGK